MNDRRNPLRTVAASLASAAAVCGLLGLPSLAAGSEVFPPASYAADPGETNDVTVSYDAVAGSYSFVDAGVAEIRDGDGPGGCEVQDNRATCPWSSSQFPYGSINVQLDDGNDKLAILSNATIVYSQVVAYGGDGADQLVAASGVRAGLTMLMGESGADTVTSEARDLGNENSPATLSGGLGEDVISGGPDNEVLEGSAWNVSDPGADTLHGGGGDDQLTGFGGNDQLFGDDGNDVLGGDGGDDLVIGGDGDDVLDLSAVTADQGTPGSNHNSGADQLQGGPGSDKFFSREVPPENENDTISCGGQDGAKDDVLIGSGDIASSDCDRVREVVSCPDTGFEPCEVRIIIDTTGANTAARRGGHAPSRGEKLVLGRARLRLKPGRTDAVSVKLKRKALRRALREREKAQVREVVSVVAGEKTSRRHRHFSILG